MFKIEPTERDTFRIRSTKNPAIVFEISTVTRETYEYLEVFLQVAKKALKGMLWEPCDMSKLENNAIYWCKHPSGIAIAKFEAEFPAFKLLYSADVWHGSNYVTHIIKVEKPQP